MKYCNHQNLSQTNGCAITSGHFAQKASLLDLELVSSCIYIDAGITISTMRRALTLLWACCPCPDMPYEAPCRTSNTLAPGCSLEETSRKSTSTVTKRCPKVSTSIQPSLLQVSHHLFTLFIQGNYPLSDLAHRLIRHFSLDFPKPRLTTFTSLADSKKDQSSSHFPDFGLSR